ncbi:hypothetical protein D3C86_1910790 [compost metagenome]
MIMASIAGLCFAIIFSQFSWIVSSNKAAIARRLSYVLEGPKKLYSIHGIP